MTRLPKRFSRPYRAIARAFGLARPGEGASGAVSRERGSEVAWASGLFFGTVPMERWNPDDLVWRRGYGVYRKMLHDDQVRALVSLKQGIITSRGWHFDVEEGDEEQQRCAELFRFVLENQLQGTFGEALRQILTSQVHGFSLTEKVYAPLEWRGRIFWGLSRLKLRPAETFQFATDVHGNLTGIVQQQGGARADMEPQRFIHHVNRPDIDPHYGESDLRACYRHWWAKDNTGVTWSMKHTVVVSGTHRSQGFHHLSGSEHLLGVYGYDFTSIRTFRALQSSVDSIEWTVVDSALSFYRILETASGDLLMGFDEEDTGAGGVIYRSVDQGSSWSEDVRIAKQGNVLLTNRADGTLDLFLNRTTAGKRTDRYRSYDPA